MGEYVSKLAALAGAPRYGMGSSFTRAGEALGAVAHAAQRARSDVGFSGEAGRAAESLLESRRRALLTIADGATKVPTLIAQANDQLDYARRVAKEIAARTAPPVRAEAAAAAKAALARTNEQEAKRAYAAIVKELRALAAELKPLAADLTSTSFPGSTQPGQAKAPGSLRALAQLTPAQLAALSTSQLVRLAAMLSKDPEKVWGWWATLTEVQRAALLTSAAPFLGRLDGLPPAVRVAANRTNAATALAANEAELARLRALPCSAENANTIALLETENEYLQRAVDGSVQLYLYDRDASRVVEVVGDLSQTPTNVIYYNPGTFTGMPDFWKGGVQTMAVTLVQDQPGAIVFVTKDGIFPGEDDTNLGGPNMTRILEANSPTSTMTTAERLASLQDGIAANPEYTYAQSTAIGHSWGLVNVTASEGAGAHYDQVISLSGAWMPEGWAPDPTTSYTDFSYPDALQVAQEFGAVGGNNVPRRPDSGFAYDPYYEAPSAFDLIGNHNLIASDAQANYALIDDLKVEIFGQ
ncbi:hypothetical protein LLS1_26470 [Leifsonia sp. LS1]|uniref:hypothetical protein n=1 Tax=Leifsonia sp. LS1 TaxID=2828483 RepID=UPI001CFD7824|nr:hypothetical protein [Leifsonia sp. LS1]GIT80978.1 hypothetical protein LLS1_26470 [Leifsonia sp. LS1]